MARRCCFHADCDGSASPGAVAPRRRRRRRGTGRRCPPGPDVRRGGCARRTVRAERARKRSRRARVAQAAGAVRRSADLPAASRRSSSRSSPGSSRARDGRAVRGDRDRGDRRCSTRVLGYVQEARAEQAVAALQRMAAATAGVVRDGRERARRPPPRSCPATSCCSPRATPSAPTPGSWRRPR